MKCTECQMENIEGALFCEECGAKLEAAAADTSTVSGSEGGVLVLASPTGASWRSQQRTKWSSAGKIPSAKCSRTWT